MRIGRARICRPRITLVDEKGDRSSASTRRAWRRLPPPAEVKKPLVAALMIVRKLHNKTLCPAHPVEAAYGLGFGQGKANRASVPLAHPDRG